MREETGNEKRKGKKDEKKKLRASNITDSHVGMTAVYVIRDASGEFPERRLIGSSCSREFILQFQPECT